MLSFVEIEGAHKGKLLFKARMGIEAYQRKQQQQSYNQEHHECDSSE